jgi:hypothetical protein
LFLKIIFGVDFMFFLAWIIAFFISPVLAQETVEYAPQDFDWQKNTNFITSTGTLRWLKDKSVVASERCEALFKEKFPGAVMLEQDEIKNPLRSQNLRDYGLMVGGQIGTAETVVDITNILEIHAKALDKIFFFPFVVKDRILPPVIQKVDFSENISADRQTLRQQQGIYRILRHAILFTEIPSWRTYLQMPQSNIPEVMIRYMESEREVLRRAFCEGYKQGQSYALYLFDQKMASLKQDFLGMMEFHLLSQRNIVSYPRVQVLNQGVVQPSDKVLVLRDTLYKIDAPTYFKSPMEWTIDLIEARKIQRGF